MLSNIVKVFIPRGVSAAGVVALTLVVPFVLDVKNAADFFIGVAALYLLSILGRLGLDVVLLKANAYQFSDERKVIRLEDLLALLFSFIFSCGVSVGFYFFYSYWIDFDLVWVCMSLPAFASIGMFSSYLRGCGYEIWASLVEPGCVSMLAAIMAGVSYLYMVEFTGVQNLFVISSWCVWVVNFMLIFYSFNFSFSFDKGLKSGEFWVGGYHLLNQFSSYMTQWYPIFLFSQMQAKLVVYYTVANRLATIISFVGVSIDAFAAPRFSRLWLRGDLQELLFLKRNIRKISGWIGVGVFLLVAIIATSYGGLLQYDSAYYFLVFLLLVSYWLSISLGPNGFYLMMVGRSQFVAMVSFVCFCVSCVFSTVLYFFDFAIGMVALIGMVVLSRSILFRWASDRVVCDQG